MADENSTETPASQETPSSDSKANSSNMVIGVVVAVIALVALLFFFMNSRNQGQESMIPTQATPTSETTNSATVDGAGEAMVVNMAASNFSFTPNVISAKLGQTVRVELAGAGMQHDFAIDELGVKSPLVQPGQSTTVEFVADTVGTFEFYCSVGNHRQMGMTGTLTVTE